MSCKNKEEVDAFWSELSEGGEEGPSGRLTTAAMLKMKKIDVRELERAAAQT